MNKRLIAKLKMKALVFVGMLSLMVAVFIYSQRTKIYLPTSAADLPLHAFVLVGQSNMVGSGTVPLIQPGSNNILKWSGLGWVTALEPLHNFNYGPGMSFALELLKSKGVKYKIGLIPCAQSGSSITRWQKGEILYENCMKEVQEAKAAGAIIEGVLISQGERDTYTKEAADAWPRLIIKFARDFRTEYGENATPFIFAQLGYDPEVLTHPYWKYLHDLQPSILDGHVNFRMVVTDDLAKKADNIHFDYDSQVIIGQRFAAKMCELISCP